MERRILETGSGYAKIPGVSLAEVDTHDGTIILQVLIGVSKDMYVFYVARTFVVLLPTSYKLHRSASILPLKVNKSRDNPSMPHEKRKACH